ncbi:hypothetical protein FRC06_003598, partial [Ceratobasidium sp. 370]
MCILHIYNLAAKAATLSFHVRHTQLEAAAKNGPDDGGESEEYQLPYLMASSCGLTPIQNGLPAEREVHPQQGVVHAKGPRRNSRVTNRALKAMSKASVPLLKDVIVLHDVLNEQYDRISHDISLPLYLYHAAAHVQTVLNKYYQKSDESLLYRLSV